MKAPQAPDPMKTAAAQSASSRDTAITQQLLNMTNQVNPYGSLTYNQSGSSSFKDASGKMVNTPTFTQTTKLSPAQQHILEQNQTADTNMNDIALGQIDRIGGVLNTPFHYDVGEHEKWAGDLYGKLNDSTNQRNSAAMETKLANQGLQPGTPAYDEALRNLTFSQEKGRNDFMLNSYGQGLDTALTNRNQPLNEVSALMSGTGVQQPQWQNTPQTGVNGVDVAGLINQNYQAQNANYQAKLGGMMGMGSAALGGWAMMSDRRAKKNISEVGKLKDGTKLYSYEYKPEVGGTKGLMYIGVMANEAQKKHPSAVARGDDGYLRVNYEKIAQELSA